ncbi:MAG: alpha/beta hydrolase [Flavobacteriaceae bacterium]
MHLKSCFLLAVFFTFYFTNAQEEYPLWKKSIPGQIKSDEVKEYATGGTAEEILRVHQVTEPTLKAYFPSKELANGAAVVICPGGGYRILAIDHEGYQIAEWLNSLGIAAFVLKYRLPDARIMKDPSVGPLQDVQKALRTVRQNAQKWNIDPTQIGIMGFSAGGHLAASLASHYQANVYEEATVISARPDFSILIYPVISFDQTMTHSGSRENLIGKNPTEAQIAYFSNELQINKNTPPTLLIHSVDDEVVPVENSLAYLKQLKKYKVESELHIFSDGGHGYGLGRGGTHSLWSKNAENWLTQILKK